MGQAAVWGDDGVVTTMTFVTALAVGAALLAIWCLQRLPGFAPTGLRGALGHVGAAMLVLHLAVPVGLIQAVESGTTLGVLLGVLGIALPPLTYVFLATLWALRVAQNAMPGLGR
jgi:hypothetical protein